MGYREGEGLGKHAQGRVNIVEASLQRGRRGLGLNLKGLEPSTDVDWKEEDDVVSNPSKSLTLRAADKMLLRLSTVCACIFIMLQKSLNYHIHVP